MNIRVDSEFAPSQWETSLLCNDVSHWLGANLELALDIFTRVLCRKNLNGDETINLYIFVFAEKCPNITIYENMDVKLYQIYNLD